MANLSFSGRITKIGVPQTGTGKNGEWTNTTVEVTEIEGEYPNSIAFSALNKQEIVERLSVGQIVDVLYNAKTSYVGDKIYNSLNFWKVDVKDEAGSSVTTTNKTTPAKNNPVEDDLPF